MPKCCHRTSIDLHILDHPKGNTILSVNNTLEHNEIPRLPRHAHVTDAPDIQRASHRLAPDEARRGNHSHSNLYLLPTTSVVSPTSFTHLTLPSPICPVCCQSYPLLSGPFVVPRSLVLNHSFMSRNHSNENTCPAYPPGLGFTPLFPQASNNQDLQTPPSLGEQGITDGQDVPPAVSPICHEHC